MPKLTNAELVEQLNTAREVITEQQAKINKRDHDMMDFRKHVREVAIEVAREQSWCMSGLNEKLDELGLEPLSTEYTLMATVTVELRVSIDDTDFDGDDVEEYLRDKLDDITVQVNNGWSESNEWSTESTGIERVTDVKAVVDE